jgi:hypothetical protein
MSDGTYPNYLISRYRRFMFIPFFLNELLLLHHLPFHKLPLTEESIIEKTYVLKISPCLSGRQANPSLPSRPEALRAGGQRGEFLPFARCASA